MPPVAFVHAAVEGLVDESVVRRLLTAVGASAVHVHRGDGKSRLREKISAYNQAARHWPWVVIVDLDNDAPCAPAFRRDWLPDPAPWMCFRIAVRAVEAWLMADAEALASFLRVPRALIPGDPESVSNPKQEMVSLARRSRLAAIREDMVPREGSGRPVGPAYPSRLIEFSGAHWRPDAAAERSTSLKRAMTRLSELLQTLPKEDQS